MLIFFLSACGFLTLLSDYNTNEPPQSRDGSTATAIREPSAAKPIRYVAVSGDTVGRMARRFLGANSKTNRDAIVALNPTLKKNPNIVSIGKSYLIPRARKRDRSSRQLEDRMIKLLICLFSGVALGLFILNIRHQQLELRHQNVELHDRFKAQQAKLWNQQQQIAVLTSPNAIKQTVNAQKLKMVPVYEAQRADWTEPAPDKPRRGH